MRSKGKAWFSGGNGVANGTRNNEIPIIVVESPPVEITSHQTLPFADEVDQDLEEEEKEEAKSTTKPLNQVQQERRKSLRRNSVSLPSGLNALELEVLRQQYKDHAANNQVNLYLE